MTAGVAAAAARRMALDLAAAVPQASHPPTTLELPMRQVRHLRNSLLSAAVLMFLAMPAVRADHAPTAEEKAAMQPAATAAAEPTAAAAKQYLAILRPVPSLYQESAWTPEHQAKVGEHFRRLQEEARAGRVILAGRTQEALDVTLGLVVFEAADDAAAKAWAEADPAVAGGVMTVEVRPYQVAVERP
jgi:uncharacterized protein YciI